MGPIPQALCHALDNTECVVSQSHIINIDLIRAPYVS